MVKKIIFLIIAFVLMIVATLGIFIYLQGGNPFSQIGMPEIVKANVADPVLKEILKKKISEIDSLEGELRKRDSTIAVRENVVDSLNNLLSDQASLVQNQKSELQKMNASVRTQTENEARAKEIAKTFESMKVVEISTILNKLDDETVRMIYQNTGSRYKKNILLALSPSRAARLTKDMLATAGG